MDKKYCVYRLFDDRDELLYVGFSGGIADRMKQHVRADMISNAVRHIELEWFATEIAARNAEKVAIFRERPKLNRYGLRDRRMVRETNLKDPSLEFLSNLQGWAE